MSKLDEVWLFDDKILPYKPIITQVVLLRELISFAMIRFRFPDKTLQGKMTTCELGIRHIAMICFAIYISMNKISRLGTETSPLSFLKLN